MYLNHDLTPGGLDTETPEGNLALICADDGFCHTDNIDTTLQFLTQKRRRGKHYFTFNLKFDAQAIIKQLPFELWMPLYQEGRIKYNNFSIRYIPSKLLGVSRNAHGGATLYDIAQYYRGESLNSAGKKFLNEEKLHSIDPKRIGESRDYYDDNINEIVKYCKQDAELTMKLGLLMKKNFEELNVDFSNPISPANLAANYVMTEYEYPMIPESIDDFHKFARHTFRGGYFQTFKRGLFEQPVYDYDINSAYPSVMYKLPHWANGKFEYSNRERCETFGWVYCKFDCPYIPYETGTPYILCETIDGFKKEFTTTNHRIIYPSGMRKQAVTAVEYDWMVKNNFKPEFIFGVYWLPNEEVKYISPFSWMEDFYDKREAIKKTNFPLQWAMKIFMNGVYGKTCQQKHGFGVLTNFFYASYITAVIRLRVANIVLHNREHILNVATDGLLSLKKLELPESRTLGEWELKEYDKALIIGNGIYQLWDKDGKYTTKARGITGRRDWNLLEAINKKPDRETLSFTKRRPVQLGECLTHTNIFKPSDLNAFKDVTKKLDVNCDKSNIWERNYSSFGELLEQKSNSKPININQQKLLEDFFDS